jgi:phosphoglycolate phosphatase/pyrophosphatase PpaX
MDADSVPPSWEFGQTLRGVLFDMDGTLVSTLPLIFHCVNQVTEKYLNKGRTLEEVIAGFVPPAREIIRGLTSHLQGNKSQAAVEDYYNCYRTNCPSKGLLFPGIPELLQKLRDEGKRLAVVTGVERVLMDCTLSTFCLTDFFDALVAGDDVQRTKPDPEMVHLALQRIGLRPRESIIVGDSPADIQAGKRAGILTGAALWSPEGRGDPTKENPDYIFRSVQELRKFLLFERKEEEPGFSFGPGWR